MSVNWKYLLLALFVGPLEAFVLAFAFLLVGPGMVWILSLLLFVPLAGVLDWSEDQWVMWSSLLATLLWYSFGVTAVYRILQETGKWSDDRPG